MIEDPTFIKEAVKRSRPVLREMPAAEHYRSPMRGASIAVIIIAFVAAHDVRKRSDCRGGDERE